MQDDWKLDEQLVDKGWADMAQILEKEMPVKKKRKIRFLWFWLLFLGLGLGYASYQIIDIDDAEEAPTTTDPTVAQKESTSNMQTASIFPTPTTKPIIPKNNPEKLKAFTDSTPSSPNCSFKGTIRGASKSNPFGSAATRTS